VTKRITGNEKKYVLDVLESEFSSSSGSKFVNRLEKLAAEQYKVKYALAFNNGTATMHTALEAMGIGEGDEVIVPPLTMASTTFVVLQANATPVFADIDPRTFNISAESISRKITKKTRAIITVALYGLSPDIDAIKTAISGRDIKIIEDNAEACLSRYNGRIVGSLGDCSSISFQSSKHLTSGEGGLLLTNCKDLALNARRVQSLGYAGVGAEKAKISKLEIQEPSYERHVSMGWNYRMPELCAAVALAQMENAQLLRDARIIAAKTFAEAIKETGCNWLIPQFEPSGYENSYWAFTCKLETKKFTWINFRDEFVRRGGDPFYSAWKLTYLEPMIREKNLLGRQKYISEKRIDEYRAGLCPIAESVQPKLIQFKTDYWNQKDAHDQAKKLSETIRYFNGI